MPASTPLTAAKMPVRSGTQHARQAAPITSSSIGRRRRPVRSGFGTAWFLLGMSITNGHAGQVQFVRESQPACSASASRSRIAYRSAILPSISRTLSRIRSWSGFAGGDLRDESRRISSISTRVNPSRCAVLTARSRSMVAVVYPLTRMPPGRRRQQAASLVIAHRLHAHTRAFGHLANGELVHGQTLAASVLAARRPSAALELAPCAMSDPPDSLHPPLAVHRPDAPPARPRPRSAASHARTAVAFRLALHQLSQWLWNSLQAGLCP
jgi:hypothetical protein